MIMDSSVHHALVRSLSDKLQACYVFPDVAGQICACLQKHLEAGEYADIDEGELLALALTMHLQEVNHDEHLWVRWHSEPLPDEEGPLRHDHEWQDERMLEARLDNYGLHRVERLPGNVGCLDIRFFHRPEWGGDTAVAAMNFLADTNALIIDLRKCTGGYPGMIALILSYLFGPEPVHLVSIYWRDDDLTQQYWTLPHVPGRRFGDKPVYVLTSRATFSGGEEFAAILQSRRRAAVIGDKTDGGAHPGASYRIHPHFEVFIPVGRAFDPLTGKDLEGIGVTPDITIPQEQAFTAAYFMALRTIVTGLGESSSAPFQKLVKEAQTALAAMESNHRICPKCGYQNALFRISCKNCEQPLPAVAADGLHSGATK